MIPRVFITFKGVERCAVHEFGPVYHGGPGYDPWPSRCIRCSDPCPKPPDGGFSLSCRVCGGELCPACEPTASWAVLEELELERWHVRGGPVGNDSPAPEPEGWD